MTTFNGQRVYRNTPRINRALQAYGMSQATAPESQRYSHGSYGFYTGTQGSDDAMDMQQGAVNYYRQMRDQNQPTNKRLEIQQALKWARQQSPETINNLMSTWHPKAVTEMGSDSLGRY